MSPGAEVIMSVRTSIGRSRIARLLGTTAVAVAALTVGAVPSAQAEICPAPGVCFPDGTTPVATTPTSITGTPKVGEVLAATEPTWSEPNTTTTTYQWNRAGTAISGESGQMYTVTAADVGQKLTVVATGDTGAAKGTSTSAPVTGVLGDAPTPNGPITIKGNPKVGGTLTVAPGTWSSDPQPGFTYQWHRSGYGGSAVKIAGATASTYMPVSADLGHKLAVVITAVLPGHANGMAVSSAVSVPKYKTYTSLTLSHSTVARNVRARGRVVVRTPDADHATGTVTLRDGVNTIGSYTMTPGDDGVLMLTLPRLRPGKHTLKAVYAGDSAHAKSSAPTTTLTVTNTVAH